MRQPLTLAHFSFDQNGKVLADNKLPANLVAPWLEEEVNRGTDKGESRYSWTVDLADRRARARKAMQPHLDEVERLKKEVVLLKEQLKKLKKDKAGKKPIQGLQKQIKAQETAIRKSRTKADG